MEAVKRLLDIAAGELGVTEHPAGSNRNKYGRWYGMDGQPWCMIFVQWCCAMAGAALPKRTPSCGDLMRTAQAAGCWVTEDFRPGDVAIYDFSGKKRTPEHCGIVERITGDGAAAIEGNTAAGNDANGGQVQRRTRAFRYIIGAVRPVCKEVLTMDNDELKALIRETVREVLEEENPVYKDLKDVPAYWQDAAAALLETGAINGGTPAAVCASDLNLRRETLKAVVAAARYHDAR